MEVAEKRLRDLEGESGCKEDYASRAFLSCHMTSTGCLAASLSSVSTWNG
jgi:hypothetical protein